MRSIVLAPLAAAFVLSACGSGGSGGSADADGDGVISNEEAQAAAANIEAPRPGMYRTTTELIEFNAPGMDESLVAMMRAGMASEVEEECRTEAEADDFLRELATQDDNDECTYSRFDVSGGNVDMQMTCESADGTSGTITIAGDIGSESADMTLEMDMQAPPETAALGMTEMQIKMSMKAERIGDCEA